MAELTFTPSCVVNLNLRFESKLQIRALQENGAFQTEQLVTQRNTGVFVLNRVPKKCTVHFQGHTAAATWNMVFDYRELPIDPRTIVASTVEIHLGTVSATDFVLGMAGEYRPGIRRSILQTRDLQGLPINDNLLVVGPVDTWSVEHGESGAEVHLEGRDLRGLLLDSPLVSTHDTFDYGPTRVTRRRRRDTILSRLNPKENIIDLVRQILKEHETLNALPDAEKVRVVGYPEEWPNGEILSPGIGSHIPRHRRGASGAGSNPGAASSNLNFWDIITRYCTLVGAIPRFVGRTLEIRYAPTLYSMISGANERIPFAGRQPRMNADETFRTVRGLVYGRDIDSMKLTRKYSGNNKPKTVRIICVNQSATDRGRGQLMEAVWPPRNAREARREGLAGTNTELRDYIGGSESGEVLNIPIRGIHNQEQLVTIARAYYEQIGRNEMTGEVSMAKLASLGGTNADPDMLRLRVGDPIELLVDASRLSTSSPIVSTLNRTAQLPFSEAVREVQQYLHDENLCRAIVASARGNIMGVLRYYRVSGIDFDWSNEAVSVKADIHNYWTPRWDYGEESALRMRRTHHATDHAPGERARVAAAHATDPRATPPAPERTAAPTVITSQERQQRLDAVRRALNQERSQENLEHMVESSRWGGITGGARGDLF